MTNPQINLTEERAVKLKVLASNRQLDFAIVLENVHDPHNIGAVMRTCDAVGIPKIYLIVSDDRGWEKIEPGINASAGARRWVDVIIFRNCKECFETIADEYEQILGTHLGESSSSLYELDMTKSTALVFGNEHSGLSEEALSFVTGNFVIPQFGMVQSLNISVACAVSAYEGLRQRLESGNYNTIELGGKQEELHQEYRRRHLLKRKTKKNIDSKK